MYYIASTIYKPSAANSAGMKRIIYKSRAKPWVSAEHLAEVLKTSRRNNAEHGLSGLLVYTNGYFLQVLEGLEQQVDHRYAIIQADQRHSHCQMICEELIFEPDFGVWNMGFWSDDISVSARDRGIVSVKDMIRELNSPWLSGKSRLNDLLCAEINRMRMVSAA